MQVHRKIQRKEVNHITKKRKGLKRNYNRVRSGIILILKKIDLKKAEFYRKGGS